MATYLLFDNDQLVKESNILEDVSCRAIVLHRKGDLPYIYSSHTGYWYKHTERCEPEEVPAIYRTLQLMLTN